jgi:hypothetical protein
MFRSNLNDKVYWYPLKLALPKNKSRKIYLETEAEQQKLLHAILGE